jgi:hypothetical protein
MCDLCGEHVAPEVIDRVANPPAKRTRKAKGEEG